MELGILYQDMDDVDYRSLHCFFMETTWSSRICGHFIKTMIKMSSESEGY